MGSKNLPDMPEENNELSADCNSMITCQDCLDVLDMIIDKEAEASTEFHQHLKDCLPCLEKYNLEQAIKDVLKKKCPQANPPEDLVASIKNKILNNAGK